MIKEKKKNNKKDKNGIKALRKLKLMPQKFWLQTMLNLIPSD